MRDSNPANPALTCASSTARQLGLLLSCTSCTSWALSCLLTSVTQSRAFLNKGDRILCLKTETATCPDLDFALRARPKTSRQHDTTPARETTLTQARRRHTSPDPARWITRKSLSLLFWIDLIRYVLALSSILCSVSSSTHHSTAQHLPYTSSRHLPPPLDQPPLGAKSAQTAVERGDLMPSADWNSPLLSSPFRRLPLNRAINPRSSKGLTAVRGREGGPFSRPEKRKGRTSGIANTAFCRGRSRSARDWLHCNQGHSDMFFFQE